MSYWRDSNFRALLTVVEELSAELDYAAYVRYLRDRERGLRKQSFRHLDRFIEHVLSLPFERRCGIVDRLKLIDRERVATDLIPFPLRDRLIEPTLSEWKVRESNNATPRRWSYDLHDLRQAVRLDANEHIARRTLVADLLRDVSHATHEIAAGFGYIGDPAQDLPKLNEAERLLEDMQDPEQRAALSRWIAEPRPIVQEWLDHPGRPRAL